MKLRARLARHLSLFVEGRIRVKSCNGRRAVILVDALPSRTDLAKIPGIKEIESQEPEGPGMRLSIRLNLKGITFPRGVAH